MSNGDIDPVYGWRLPRIVGVAFVYAQYVPPRVEYIGDQRIERHDAVEIFVQTEAKLPIRAVTPVLFVGSVMVSSVEAHSETLYRFVAYDYSQLQGGAVIALGWPQIPDAREPSQFSYQQPALV